MDHQRPAAAGRAPGWLAIVLIVVSLALFGIAFALVRKALVGASVTALATATVLAPTFTSLPTSTSIPPTATTGASATPTPGQDQRIAAYIASLTPAQQAGQLLMMAVYADGYNVQLDQALTQWHIGNAIVFTQYNGGPLKPTTLGGMQQLVQDLKSHADSPMLIATDEEGGIVDRLAPYDGPSPSAQQLTATGNPQQAYQQGQTDAEHMQAIGINVDFAPVVDVYQGGAIDRSRMFGTTVNDVTTYAGAFLDGLQQHGVAGTLKHWPGLGATPANPDNALPTSSHTQAQINAIDAAPFRNLLTHQPDMIMVTHLIVPAYDAEYPASLSPKLVDQLLRSTLGYQGVVVTDAMDANGLIQFMQQRGYTDPAQGIAEASVLAILAGDDIVEAPIEQDRLAATVAAITTAIQSGRISSDRLHQALTRIIRLKVQLGLVTLP